MCETDTVCLNVLLLPVLETFVWQVLNKDSDTKDSGKVVAEAQM